MRVCKNVGEGGGRGKSDVNKMCKQMCELVDEQSL